MCLYPTPSASRTAYVTSPVPFLNLYVPSPMIGMSTDVSSSAGPVDDDGPPSFSDDTGRNVRSGSVGIRRAADPDAMDE